MSFPEFVYANRQETILRQDPKAKAKELNHVLLGTYLEVLDSKGSYYQVATRRAGPGGWVAKADTTESTPLKVFFVDVGQGDGTLIETPQGIVIIDGGMGAHFHAFLRHRYWPLIENGEIIEVKAMVISHPDGDHYKGLQRILEDEDFRVDAIYHNGLMRYPKSTEDSRRRMIEKGHVVEADVDGDTAYFVVDHFDGLAEAFARKAEMPSWFKQFWTAAKESADAGRLNSVQRLVAGDSIAGFTTTSGGKAKLVVLAPAPHQIDDADAFLAFDDPKKRADGDEPDYPDYGYSHSHTRNGHSIVVRLEFGDHKLLLGGDLNIPAERHLIEHYGTQNPFRVDVAKCCHHGSADFSPEFLKRVSPHATTISSGDNKSFDHPTADSVGAIARHSRGDLPLVFSTELARAYSISSAGHVNDIHYGLVNLRSNGTLLTMAQMKEQHSGTDIWDSYNLPWAGKFWF
ncbi:MAG: MBL fold metallo-hydrolase [bacterium]|nr:MBL fold metallo-hydrolase [bacterium]